MRFTAPLAALVLAAVAWVACWQQVQLVRLKRQVVAQAAAPAPPPVAASRPLRPAPRTQSQLDRLGALLVQRREAIADAREAASDFNIADGTPEMDRAIALATRDLDQAIVRLAGPILAAQLEIVPVHASIPANVSVAPAPPAPPVPPSPGPTYVYAPTSNVYVNAPQPAPAPVVESDSPDATPVPIAEMQPLVYGGVGFGTGRAQRTTARHLTQAEQLKELTASAGIPLGASPAALVATTSPLLLRRQRSGSGASGR